MFSIARVIFWILNRDHFPDLELSVFFYGVRFDWVALSYLLIPFTFVSLLPVKNTTAKWRKKTLSFLFYSGLISGLLFNFIDVIYFNFIFKRSTSDFFQMVGTGNDVQRLLPTFIKDFWYMFFVFGAIIWLIVKLYGKTNQIEDVDQKGVKYWLKSSLFFVLGVLFTGIGARGGMQLKPLTIADGGRYTDSQNIPVLLNTPFTIFLSIQSGDFTKRVYFENQDLSSIYSPQSKINGKGQFKGRNVVVIILESFASEYIGYYNPGEGYTPFLDSLLSESYVFINHRANGLKSIEALPAIFAGIPALDNTPYILSKQSTNQLYALPHRLKELGYSTSFFHGGENGTMGFNAFCGLAGIEKYYGLNEYPNRETDYDGNWGIYDEPYLQYFKKEIDGFKSPFFTSVFTLSSHHPYSIPDELSDSFPQGNLDVHETIGYTDYSLRKFFESAKHAAWFENTLFMITADHPAQSQNKYFVRANGKFKVPLAIYDPRGQLIGTSDKIAKHADIPNTLLSLLGDEVDILNFGDDLMTEQPFFVNFKSDGYHFRKDGLFVLFNGDSVTRVYQETDSLLKYNLVNSPKFAAKIDSIVKQGKVYLQEYSTRILQNRLTPEQ